MIIRRGFAKTIVGHLSLNTLRTNNFISWLIPSIPKPAMFFEWMNTRKYSRKFFIPPFEIKYRLQFWSYLLLYTYELIRYIRVFSWLVKCFETGILPVIRPQCFYDVRRLCSPNSFSFDSVVKWTLTSYKPLQKYKPFNSFVPMGAIRGGTLAYTLMLRTSNPGI